MNDLDKIMNKIARVNEQKLIDSLQSIEDLQNVIKEKKKVHYSELKKGDMWLMKSGRIAHLIGTELLGDLSFLFKYTDGDREIFQTYPNYPGVKDEPVLNYKYIRAYKENMIKKYEIELNTEINNMILKLGESN